jgi:hypothetical protein
MELSTHKRLLSVDIQRNNIISIFEDMQNLVCLQNVVMQKIKRLPTYLKAQYYSLLMALAFWPIGSLKHVLVYATNTIPECQTATFSLYRRVSITIVSLMHSSGTARAGYVVVTGS